MAGFPNPYDNDAHATRGLLMGGYGFDGGNACALHGGGIFLSAPAAVSAAPSIAPSGPGGMA